MGNSAAKQEQENKARAEHALLLLRQRDEYEERREQEFALAEAKRKRKNEISAAARLKEKKENEKRKKENERVMLSQYGLDINNIPDVIEFKAVGKAISGCKLDVPLHLLEIIKILEPQAMVKFPDMRFEVHATYSFTIEYNKPSLGVPPLRIGQRVKAAYKNDDRYFDATVASFNSITASLNYINGGNWDSCPLHKIKVNGNPVGVVHPIRIKNIKSIKGPETVVIDMLNIKPMAIPSAPPLPLEAECVICVGSIGVRPYQQLKCGHTFCNSCIAKWLEEHTTCPTCRASTQ